MFFCFNKKDFNVPVVSIILFFVFKNLGKIVLHYHVV